MLSIHTITIGLSGSFIFYTNFTHYINQYNTISICNLILMDLIFNIMPVIHAIIYINKYIIYPLPYNSIILEYIYGFLYFNIINTL
jgi:hypothetical protein